jgi:hypothetical protein
MNGPNISNLVHKVERIVPGTTHPYLGSIPSKGTIPLAETLTGTIETDSSVGDTEGLIVLGTGTIFLTELNIGDFLYDGDAAIRKILYIFSDTMLQIEEKFPADLSADPVLRPKNQFYKQIIAKSTGTVDAELQEAVFRVGEDVVLGGSPVAYDCSTANTLIEFTCSK